MVNAAPSLSTLPKDVRSANYVLHLKHCELSANPDFNKCRANAPAAATTAATGQLSHTVYTRFKRLTPPTSGVYYVLQYWFFYWADGGAGGGEVAPVDGGSDFSVPPPVAATADDAARLEQLLRAKAAANGDQIEQLHVLRPLTLALALDVRVHDARAALCASANDYLSLIAPPGAKAGTGVVSDYAVSFHGGADQNAWGFVDALRAGFGTPIGACEGEDSSITAAAAPASAPAPTGCARMLATLHVDAAAAAQECQAAAAHAWLTATITNSSKDPRTVACLADGLSAAGATVWTGADFRDPGWIGHLPGGGIDLDAGQTRSITWQVDQPPAASYRLSCRIDRSVGS